MKISVVLTAMNNQDSIVESFESLLSQRRLPDQLGVVLGPSYDGTHDFINFYRDEIDFCRLVQDPQTSQFGRGKLRLRGLDSVDGDYVLFVPADVFLYPEALERLGEVVGAESTDLDSVLSSINVIDSGDDLYNWGLDRLGAPAILSMGPLNPASVLFNTSTLRDNLDSLEKLACGPFTTLGWLLTVLSDPSARAKPLAEPVAELWSFQEGTSCWDNSVAAGLLELIYLVQQIIPDEVDRVLSWVDQFEHHADTAEYDELQSILQGRESTEPTEEPWFEQSIPFSE